MNIKKRQRNRFSDRWREYNRRYWANWAIERVKAAAKEYDDFFNKTQAEI